MERDEGTETTLIRSYSFKKSLRNATCCFFILFCLIVSYAYAEDGILVIHVTNPAGRPLSGVVISATGDSSQQKTNGAGKARIALAPQTKPNDEITLTIVSMPEGTSWAFISPTTAGSPPPIESMI